MSHINDNISKTITFSRFPLIFLIVLLHTIVLGQTYPRGIDIPAGKYVLLDVVQFVSQREIGDLGVPAFFFISGFLFFGMGKMDVYLWKGKLRKRVHTLLVPYLIWNTLFLLYYLVLSRFMDLSWGVKGQGASVYLNAYLGFNESPFLSPLWFIRDLMVLNVLSLPAYYIIKKTGYWLLPIFVLLFSMGIGYYLPYIGFRSVVPFFLGAWFAVNHISFIVEKNTNLLLMNVLFGALVFVVTIFHFHGIACWPLQQVELLIGIFTLFADFNYLLRKKYVGVNKKLADSSFFVFVAHMFIINIPNKLWVLFFTPSGITASLMQWLIPILVSVLLFWIFIGLKGISPKLMSVLIGGR
ncbi:MAG: acyltransferase family protein [Prevotella sp.]|nr:acyltransferase family protein [Prevotella sp.]